eukprot:35619_1
MEHQKSESASSVKVELEEIDSILDAIHELTAAETSHDASNPLEVIIQNEMQQKYKDEIEKTQQIMTDKNLDGSVIALHCNNQQELEQFLHTHLGELWSHKTQHCTTIAQSLMKQHINQIRNYSLQQMIHFIAHFEIRATIHTITSGDWDEAKYKTAITKPYEIR